MSKTGDMPAFPLPDTYHPSGQVEYGAPGLTKREYIAIEAMAALIASNDDEAGDRIYDIPTYAFQIADAMLEESEKGTGQ